MIAPPARLMLPRLAAGNRPAARRRARLLAWLLALLLLVGCDGWQLPRLVLPATLTPQPPPGVFPTASPTPRETEAARPTPAPPELVIWLPPPFDPMADTPAGKLLNQQITRFAQENPGVKIQVRVKTQSGPGGLLESLSAASAAAPAAVPSLVALSRADLETAALKGLVFPLDALGDLAADADWYPYAQRLGQVQGTSFGLPFGGDALVLVYRPARMGPAPTDWNGVLRLAQPVVFPAADPQGLTTLSLYASLGGTLEDEQRRPALQADVLARALKLYADGGQQGVFPFWLSQVQTDDQAWQAYRDQRAQWLVTWASRYLSQLPPDSSAAPMPSLGDKPLTISTGWVWAVTEPEPEQQAAAARLAQHLAQPEFLGKWNEALGLLPVRPSTLNAWGDSSLRALLSQVVSSAQLRPSNDLFASIGPALEGATVQVIKRDSDPGQAAADAADRLAIPINK